MTLQVYNSLSRQKEPFEPMVPGKAGMYVCGLTIYDHCHLGHARMLTAFDVIARHLASEGLDVTYVRNITDIDDKIIQRAAENGESVDELTARFTASMHKDCDDLGLLRPTVEPTATGSITEIIAMIATLVEKGFAYQGDNGDVYYAVKKFEGYGKLSGKQIDDLQVGAAARTKGRPIVILAGPVNCDVRANFKTSGQECLNTVGKRGVSSHAQRVVSGQILGPVNCVAAAHDAHRNHFWNEASIRN